MNREELIHLFMEEAEELLSDLSSSLLSLEKNSTDEDTIKTLFRAAHTLKGSSGSFLNLLADLNPHDSSIAIIDSIATLTHSFESLMAEVRDNGHLLTDDELELLFTCEEKLSYLFESLESPDDVDVNIDFLLSALKDAINNSYFPTKNTNTTPVKKESKKEKEPTTNRTLQISIECDENFPSASVMVFYQDFKNEFEGSFDFSFSPLEEKLINFKKGDIVYLSLNCNDVQFSLVNNFLEKHADITSFNEANSVVITEPTPEIKKETSPQVKNTISNIPTTIKVNTEKLDDVLNHVSKLVILKNKLLNLTQIDYSIEKLSKEIEEYLKDIKETAYVVSQTVEYVQEGVMSIRMIPLDQSFNRFPKYVRQMAKETKKEIDFTTLGGETEMDKILIDNLSDPLMHLVRNSVDHGIELPEVREKNGKNRVGTITLSAKHDQGNVVITIEDDGAGINKEKVLNKAVSRGVVSEEQAKTMSDKDIFNLIFSAGLSTAENVTAISGRGVGMDVVKNNIVENMKGQIDIDSVEGKGTKFIIRLPLTLAIIDAMLTKINDDVYAFPSSQVASVEEIYTKDIKTVSNNEIYILKERKLELPIIRLKKFFNLEDDSTEKEKLNIVVVKTINNHIGLVVDDFLNQEFIVLKNMGKFLGKVPGISGCNVLGNGEISLIVDVNSILTEIQRKNKTL